jgi:hypothetical protein
LDAARSADQPDATRPPPDGFTAGLLVTALRAAVASAAAPCPLPGEGSGRLLARWGEQLDIRVIASGSGGEAEVSDRAVAGYIAKYATKATESFGPALDRRLGAAEVANLPALGLPAHIAGMVQAAWSLGARPELARLGLRRWAHMLGFRGHWSTRSRRYSTTFTTLRRARAEHVRRARFAGGVPLDAWGRPEDDDAAVALAHWTYAGSGYRNAGEAWLAEQAAARAREHRQLAREHLCLA